MKPSAQQFLEVKDIREGVMILKNNDLRGVLMASSANFALQSYEEQSAIIYAFQNFLNSLDFSCQILIQSRNINITPYLDSVKALEEQQQNELLKTQAASYEEFIRELVKGDNIMTKNFYVVVPYAATEALGTAFVTKGIFGQKGKDLNDQEFQQCKNQLWQRMEFTAMGLKRCQLDVAALNSRELIELLWAIHHPNQAEVGHYPEILPELIQ